MVFKIRDKSLFWTKAGWKNNWEPKILNMPKRINSPETNYFVGRKDYHSFLRMVQSYRNYSRIFKQYMYGDRKMEELVQMELRKIFRLPFNVQTPVELIKHGGQRRMADQLDRDYELMTYNTHPYQLYAYRVHNQRIRKQNEDAQKHEKGEKTEDDLLSETIQAELQAEKAKLPQGETLSLEKVTEVLTRILNAQRAYNEESNTRGNDGEFNDYLERRRPFVEAHHSRTSQ